MRYLFLCAALLLAAPAAAQQQTTIYHCTGADGAVTLQNDTPCPAGTAQKKRVIDVPPPLPAFVPPADPDPDPPRLMPITAVPAPAELEIEGEAGAQEPQPPPPLFQCTTYDDNRYYSEEAEPPSRCQPIATTGIGGLPGIGAGEACMRVYDECEPVPEAALCRAWDARLREAEFRWKFAGGRAASEQLRAEYERLSEAVQGSTCAE